MNTTFNPLLIYVASSWRNYLQQGVVHILRAAGHNVYDFRNPSEEDRGFSWREVDDQWQDWTPSEYLRALEAPPAIRGFRNDFDAMQAADACVLVMPCGRSAHLEAGWFVGAGKPLYILIPEKCEPELMYKMATKICLGMNDLFDALGCQQESATSTSSSPADLRLPWMQSPRHLEHIHDAEGNQVADMCRGTRAEGVTRAKYAVACANACAGLNPEAVPAMYAALKRVEAHARAGTVFDPSEEWAAILAAIAKAEGGNPT